MVLPEVYQNHEGEKEMTAEQKQTCYWIGLVIIIIAISVLLLLAIRKKERLLSIGLGVCLFILLLPFVFALFTVWG